jgi:hypothetical protein
MDAHTTLQAVFTRAVTVSSFTDTSNSATTPGTLRYALTNAQDDDIITFSGVTSGTTSIALESALPEITKNLTIQGNGVTITRAASWIGSDLNISSAGAVVNIDRIHFKGSNTDRALYNSGSLTLESCVFSGNQRNGYGGAIYNEGTLTVRGCTFYNNSSDYGGAVYADYNSTVTLTGNLFYGNTAGSGWPVVYRYGGTVSSGGYNVVDVPLGTSSSQSGFANEGSDSTFAQLSITGVPFDTTTFAPVSGLDSVITSRPEGFPATDFNGANRTYPGAPGAVKQP